MKHTVAALLAFAGLAVHPVPSPSAITGQVLDWLGVPIYYRLEPTPNPLSKLIV
jgi:hypothetical protein